MWQTRADDPDGWLDGGPDEHGAHQPGDVDGLGDLGEVIDAHDTGDADTVIPVSGPAGLRSRVLPNKLPSSMMPHTAAFFLFDICSFKIGGNATARTMTSLSMLMMPSARKNVLTSIRSPLVPLNWVQ